ncbi:Rpr2-domain-containing protein [Hypoxylon rubiginosum]|uniref:Rpr2-domain-containing protein n=1 Tax=Hypoxylon rubiginosum TaxID=110542 RepID=A0ACB9YJE1_9PEZI|nr:Rpr2-domain-containing protein [Hypoxylon rubiginosum]
MGKSKEPGTILNRSIYSRISYLYQAAAYLGTLSQHTDPNSDTQNPETTGSKAALEGKQASRMRHANQVLSRRLVTDLRATSHKSQIRISPAMKQSICKYCDTLLIEGETSSSAVENKSKGGKKPWADVLVVKCHTCQGVKRFHVQAPRQKRRPIREKESNRRHEKGLNEQHGKETQGVAAVMGV